VRERERESEKEDEMWGGVKIVGFVDRSFQF
jgi:hypothetical protein